MKYYKPVCSCGCKVDIEVSLTAEVICPECGKVIQYDESKDEATE